MSIQVFKYITKSITYTDIYRSVRGLNKQPIPHEVVFNMARRCGKTMFVRHLLGFEVE